MPHITFEPANLSVSANLVGRPVIPGVEPGGSRAGQPMKPALLIKDAWLELRDYRDSGAVEEVQTVEVLLKLSRDKDLEPGLLLSVGRIRAVATATANQFNQIDVKQEFEAQGTIWAPAYVGLRVIFTQGTPTTVLVIVHLDYEQIDIPWVNWFIGWEFLDNVVDNSRDY